MRADVTVTLVNPSERFTERLRMHQIATRQPVQDIRLPDLVKGTGVRFVNSRAVTLGAHVVSLENGRSLPFDALVFAIGSVADTASVLGAGEFTYTLDTPTDAKRPPATGTIAVCGGGLTGIESAAEIAEQHPAAHVVLLTKDTPGWMMSPKARAYLDKSLSGLGVEIRAGVEVIKVLPDGVELAGGETRPACTPPTRSPGGCAASPSRRSRSATSTSRSAWAGGTRSSSSPSGTTVPDAGS